MALYRIRLKDDDYGVYAARARGEFRTPLVFRGTEEETAAYMATHVEEVRMSGGFVRLAHPDEVGGTPGLEPGEAA